MEKRCICAGSVVVKDGKVLLLWHRKLSKWLYAGGHVDEGELPHETAVRETREETGYPVRLVNTYGFSGEVEGDDAVELPGPFTILYEKVKYPDSLHYHFDMIYLSTPLGNQEEIEDRESKKLQWFSESEVDALDTFSNVPPVLHRAIAKARELGIK